MRSLLALTVLLISTLGAALGTSTVSCSKAAEDSSHVGGMGGGGGSAGEDGSGADGGSAGSNAGAGGDGGSGASSADGGASGSGGGSGGADGGSGNEGGSGGSNAGTGGLAGAGGSGGSEGGVCSDQIVESQEQWDALVAENCREINGELKLFLTLVSVTSFNELKNLEIVRGNMQISGFAGTSLVGLEKLATVGDRPGYGLLITYNAHLTSLGGLENLTTVGGPLLVTDNSRLTSLGGLEGLTSVRGVRIDNNPALITLDPLHNWPGDASGAMVIADNAKLPQCEVDNFDAEQTNPEATCLDDNGLSRCINNTGSGTCD